MLGDSLLIDDEDVGWAHHLAYRIGRDSLPFDVVNLARSGATIIPPAHAIGMKDGEGANCYGAQTKGGEYFIGQYAYNIDKHG